MKILRFTIFFPTLAFGFAVLAPAQNAIIRGVVYDQSTGQTIPAVNVGILGTIKGSITDENGFFQVTRLENKPYALAISAVGYQSDTIVINLLDRDFADRSIFLVSMTYEIGDVVVTGAHQGEVSRTNVSISRIKSADLKKMPGYGASADLAQAVQTLPGVVFTGDQGGQLYIRGGSPVMNKVLMDGITIYAPFHSMGMFSVFNSDAIQQADVFTGGFGAQYSGRISSIMDIKMRDGNPKRFSGQIATDPFQAELLAEGPVIRQKPGESGSLTYLITGKKSLIDRVGTDFFPWLDSTGLPFGYEDLFAKITLRGNYGDQIKVLGFRSADRVNYPGLVSMDWASAGGGIQATIVPYGSKAQIIPWLNYSDYRINYLAKDTLPKSSQISGFEGGLKFRYLLDYNEFEFGVGLNGINTLTNFKNSAGRRFFQEDHSTDLTGYMRYLKRWKNWVVEAGLSMNYYASLRVFSPEPRLRVNFSPVGWLHLKAAMGLYSQNLLTTNSDRDVVNLFYGFLATPTKVQNKYFGIPVKNHLQKARHYIFGFEIDGSQAWNLYIEGFVKDYYRLINVNRNQYYEDMPSNSDKPEYLKKTYIMEEGLAYGMDGIFSYQGKGFGIKAIYSLCWNTRSDEIQKYIPHYDRRHNINLLANYSFGRSRTWNFSLRWNLGSGLPMTQTQGYYDLMDPFNQPAQYGITRTPSELGIIYAGYNEGRLPAYHRLDLNVRKLWSLKFLDIELNVGVINVYNRRNLFYFDRLSYKQVNQLPVLPAVGMIIRIK